MRINKLSIFLMIVTVSVLGFSTIVQIKLTGSHTEKKLQCRALKDSQGETKELQCRHGDNENDYHSATPEEKKEYCDGEWRKVLEPYKQVGRPPTNVKIDGCEGTVPPRD
jgi:hypothetical protein